MAFNNVKSKYLSIHDSYEPDLALELVGRDPLFFSKYSFKETSDTKSSPIPGGSLKYWKKYTLWVVIVKVASPQYINSGLQREQRTKSTCFDLFFFPASHYQIGCIQNIINGYMVPVIYFKIGMISRILALQSSAISGSISSRDLSSSLQYTGLT